MSDRNLIARREEQPQTGGHEGPGEHGKLNMNQQSALVAEKLNYILGFCTLQSISSEMREMILSFSIGEAIPGVLGPILPHST